MSPQAKPSRIPTPESTTRPLPSHGYVADSVVLPKPRPLNEDTPPITLVHSQKSAPSARPTKTITVKLRGIPKHTKPTTGKYEHSNEQTAATKSDQSKRSNPRGIETTKKPHTKTRTATDKSGTMAKLSRAKPAHHRRSNSWAKGGRLNELRIR